MKKRNIVAVIILSIVTCGIYSIVFYVKTKGEMVTKGAVIPTCWLLIVPIVNFYWLWKYSEGVAKVTNNAFSNAVAFILLFFLGFIGQAIIQSKFNEVV
jgi:hypothetical protein